MNCREAIDVMGEAVEGAAFTTWPGFEEHLRDCAPCRNYLDQLRMTRRALRLLSKERGEAPNRQELIDRFRKEPPDS